MLHYTDIHCHMLSGTDDGARTDEEMFAMLDAAYASGTRSICLTPHFNPMCFGDNRERGERAYEKLCAYAHESRYVPVAWQRAVLSFRLYRPSE